MIDSQWNETTNRRYMLEVIEKCYEDLHKTKNMEYTNTVKNQSKYINYGLK